MIIERNKERPMVLGEMITLPVRSPTAISISSLRPSSSLSVSDPACLICVCVYARKTKGESVSMRACVCGVGRLFPHIFT